jgi:hypothetical protein
LLFGWSLEGLGMDGIITCALSALSGISSSML